MAQKKLKRFAELKTFSNVLEYPSGMAGAWGRFFGNNNPIVLELACGRGEYTVGLSALYPDMNFIGIDIKGNRMYIGAKQCLEEKRSNTAFLRTQIEMLNNYFAPGEVEGIWLTFPDPQLRTSRAKKRLTHPRFLRIYRQLLRPGGSIHLKTDSPNLYQFTKRVIGLYDLIPEDDIEDIYIKPDLKKDLQIKTHYEKLDIAKSRRIHYLKFSLPGTIRDIDEQLQEILKHEEQAG